VVLLGGRVEREVSRMFGGGRQMWCLGEGRVDGGELTGEEWSVFGERVPAERGVAGRLGKDIGGLAMGCGTF